MTNEDGRRYFVRLAKGQWQLMRHEENSGNPLYIFREVPRTLSDYEDRCEYHQASPDSHFTKTRVCSLANRDGRVTLSGMRLIVTRDGRREEFTVSGKTELRRCLHDRFGIEFDSTTDLTRLTL